MRPIPRLHAAAGLAAMAAIVALQGLTALSETSGYGADILLMRERVLWIVGLVLLPAMMAAGLSGFRLGRGWRRPEVAAKAARMRLIAAIGLLILLPLAVGLWWLAAQGMIEGRFHLLQRIESLAGLVNLLLLGLNLRDGMRLRPRRRAA